MERGWEDDLTIQQFDHSTCFADFVFFVVKLVSLELRFCLLNSVLKN